MGLKLMILYRIVVLLARTEWKLRDFLEEFGSFGEAP